MRDMMCVDFDFFDTTIAYFVEISKVLGLRRVGALDCLDQNQVVFTI